MGDYVQADQVKRDPISGGQVTTDAPHYELHEGEMRVGSSIFRALADGAVTAMALKVGSEQIHLVFGLAVSGESEWFIFEGSTYSATGTAGILRNPNRTKTDATEELVFVGPSLAVSGTLLAQGLIPGTTGPGGRDTSGGVIRSGAEWVFKPDTWYSLVLLNASGGAIDGSVSLEYYTAEEG